LASPRAVASFAIAFSLFLLSSFFANGGAHGQRVVV
jgi:hypothetical protein